MLGASSAPEWWRHLTVERWADLLKQEGPAEETIEIECTNVIVPLIRGVGALVLDAVELSIAASGESAGSTLQVARDGGGKGAAKEWSLNLDHGCSLVDSDPPPHKSAIRYTVNGQGLKKTDGKSDLASPLGAWGHLLLSDRGQEHCSQTSEGWKRQRRLRMLNDPRGSGSSLHRCVRGTWGNNRLLSPSTSGWSRRWQWRFAGRFCFIRMLWL